MLRTLLLFAPVARRGASRALSHDDPHAIRHVSGVSAGRPGLAVLGAQSLRGRGSAEHAPPTAPLRDGLVTSVANPKLAVFFAALFPQFVPDGARVLPAALLMAATIVTFDLVWYSTLAYLVARTKRAFVEGPWLRRFERVTGVVLVGLGVRLALERR